MNYKAGAFEKIDNVKDIQYYPPNWEDAFHLLYGFCLGKGLGEEIKKIPEISDILRPKFLFKKESGL